MWNVDVGIEAQAEFVLYDMDKDLGIESWDHGFGFGMEAAQYEFTDVNEAETTAIRIRAWLMVHGFRIAATEPDEMWDPTDGATVTVALLPDDDDDDAGEEGDDDDPTKLSTHDFKPWADYPAYCSVCGMTETDGNH